MELVFASDEKITGPLKTCFQNYQDENMVFFCKDVCNNFRYMKIPEYFFPQVNKIRNYTLFLRKSLDVMLGESGEAISSDEERVDPNALLGEIKVFKSLLSDNY